MERSCAAFLAGQAQLPPEPGLCTRRSAYLLGPDRASSGDGRNKPGEFLSPLPADQPTPLRGEDLVARLSKAAQSLHPARCPHGAAGREFLEAARAHVLRRARKAIPRKAKSNDLERLLDQKLLKSAKHGSKASLSLRSPIPAALSQHRVVNLYD